MNFFWFAPPEIEYVSCDSFQEVDCKPLEHPALLQYLPKLGIDHDIAHQHLPQADFKALRSLGATLPLVSPCGRGFEARKALFRGGCSGSGQDSTLAKITR
jgi:hypothetical protein